MSAARGGGARAQAKEIWVETQKQEILTAALEAGVRTFLFPAAQEPLAAEWQSLGRFRAVLADEDGLLTNGDESVGRIARIRSKQDVEAAEALAGTPGAVVMDAADWQIIPAENLVAVFQGQPATLLGRAASASDARVLLEALEVGTAGVVLRPDSAAEVREVCEYVARLNSQAADRLAFEAATVTRVEPLGMGDRVAVDMCSLLAPGEGLLVGSFSRGLFLVHSECAESRYIASRPFRANCGPVHAYLAMPGGKTAYLSELQSGREVLVVSPEGRQRTAVVGRVKIETRPLVLVEAEAGGERFSSLLQNAETVRLVGPVPGGKGGGWRAVPVTELRQGDALFVHRQAAARHAGVAIQETIVER